MPKEVRLNDKATRTLKQWHNKKKNTTPTTITSGKVLTKQQKSTIKPPFD